MAEIQRDQFDGVVRRLLNLRGDLTQRVDPTIVSFLELLGSWPDWNIAWDEDTDFWCRSVTGPVAGAGNITAVEVLAQTGGTTPDRIIVDGLYATSDVLAGNNIEFRIGTAIGGASTQAQDRGPRGAVAGTVLLPSVVMNTAQFVPPLPGQLIYQSTLPLPPEGVLLPFPVVLEHIGAVTQSLGCACTLVATPNIRVSAWGRVYKGARKG